MGVVIAGGGVGLVPVLMDLIQTPDKTRGHERERERDRRTDGQTDGWMLTFAWAHVQVWTEPCSSLLCEETPTGSDAGRCVSAPVQPAYYLDLSP